MTADLLLKDQKIPRQNCGMRERFFELSLALVKVKFSETRF